MYPREFMNMWNNLVPIHDHTCASTILKPALSPDVKDWVSGMQYNAEMKATESNTVLLNGRSWCQHTHKWDRLLQSCRLLPATDKRLYTCQMVSCLCLASRVGLPSSALHCVFPNFTVPSSLYIHNQSREVRDGERALESSLVLNVSSFHGVRFWFCFPAVERLLLRGQETHTYTAGTQRKKSFCKAEGRLRKLKFSIVFSIPDHIKYYVDSFLHHSGTDFLQKRPRPTPVAYIGG